MISIIITSHGKMASGMFESLKMIFGINENIQFIDFTEGMSTEMLEQEYRKAINKYILKSDIVFLTDIKGGSPFKTAATVSLEFENKIAVISGMNLPMLISLASEMEDISINEAVDLCLKTGKDEIEKFELLIKQTEEGLDGI